MVTHPVALRNFTWEKHCGGLFELSVATFRSRRRAPNLTAADRTVMGLCTLFMNPSRIRKVATALKPATLMTFHQALKERKYRRLFSPQRRGKLGPKGPSKELIQAIVEMKRRNSRYGCPRIAQQLSKAFDIEIDKDVVRRSCEILLATARRRVRLGWRSSATPKIVSGASICFGVNPSP